MPKAVVLFDGVCNVCNGSVQFLIDRDPERNLAFAPLQSDKGRELLAAHGLGGQGDQPRDQPPDTMVLVEGGRAFTGTTAALKVLGHLRQPWPLLRALWIIPRPLRDVGYRVLVRNRYRWFGRQETCRIPTPELRSRFLDVAS